MQKPLRVLIVEDSEDDARLLLRALEHQGYGPVSERVESAEAMAAALDKGTWEVVLCDYSMPGFSAAVALSLLQKAGLDLPFIVVSGTIGEEQAVEMMKAGVHDYILKDNLTRLVPAIERELEEAENRRQRKRAEEAVRKSEARLRSVLEASTDAFWEWNVATGASFLSPRWAELLGYRLDELEPHVGTWERLVHPEDAPRVMEELKAHLEGASPRFVSEHRVITKSGEEKWLLDRGKVVERDADGKALRMVGSYIDISERKSLEFRLVQAKKMEAVGRLAGGIAHDFNNLLTVIKGFSDLALEKLDTDDPARGDLELIREAGEKATDLTRQLLAFSRLQVLQPTVLNLNTVVAEFETLLHRTIGEDIEILTVLDPALGRVKADPGQVEQILLNLAVNARDAMPDGGELTLETANVELDDAYSNQHVVVTPGHYVMLAVTDTGVGMDEETQSRIFEPFFTTKEKGEGTGFGLATIYGIVKQSGGYIWVYSEPREGTTFKIYLPRVEEETSTVRRQLATAEVEGGSETVLLVEDDEMVRAFALRVLTDRGYQVLVSAHPEEALQICQNREESIDLLVTDLVMPGCTGIELAERIGQLVPGVKTLYISGYPGKGVLHNGQLEEHVDFLGKPFSASALARKVREILERGST